MDVSSIYETKPFGNIKQENFFNAVIKIRTSYELKELFNFLKSIEKKIGRTKTIKWGPREIDLDLLFYNNLIYSDEYINVPHKGIAERDFVLVPIVEIEPELVHPVLKKKISDIYEEVTVKNILNKKNQQIFISNG
jgi:2-amino-4-hydroxy-6-hydroxymethyldihydropteridine diphosphokinase